jgi:hypothetical protein
MRMKILAGLSVASLLCASLLFAQALPEMRMLPAEMRGRRLTATRSEARASQASIPKCRSVTRQKRAFIRSCCSCRRTRRFRRIRTAMIAWRRWCQAPGISVMATVSTRNPSRSFRPAASTRSRALTTTSRARKRTLSSCKSRGMVRPTRTISIQPTNRNRHDSLRTTEAISGSGSFTMRLKPSSLVARTLLWASSSWPSA